VGKSKPVPDFVHPGLQLADDRLQFRYFHKAFQSSRVNAKGNHTRGFIPHPLFICNLALLCSPRDSLSFSRSAFRKS
jgi:hypothetical protein